MENQYIYTNHYYSPEDIVKDILNKNTALIICFYGADFDYKTLYNRLRVLKRNFIGCMDVGRFYQDKYFLDQESAVIMTFSDDIIEKIEVTSYDMRKNASYNSIHSSVKDQYKSALEKMKIDPKSPDFDRELTINFLYGLQSASPVLKAQNEVSLFLQSVGGSSGGKLDFINSSVISNKGYGSIGASAIIRLKPEFKFLMDRVSSFDRIPGELEVTKLASPRHILEFNHKPALDEYCRVIGIDSKSANASTYALYTLGVEPGDGERLITSIMKDDGEKGFLTYNDVVDGVSFNLYKALKQENDRKAILSKIDYKKLIAYLSFDCVLCYLARNENSEIEKIASLYDSILPVVPKIGFGTFSENICGANVNQTETFLAISSI